MNIAGLLLAAGNSTRFGQHKLTFSLPDGVQVGIRSASVMAGVMDECYAVVRHQDQAFTDQLRRMGFNIVVQPSQDAGMGNSLALGVQASQHADGWVIALADMPWIQQQTLRAVISTLQAGAAIAAPCYQDKRGHPVGFSQLHRSELMLLNEDKGARQLLRDYSNHLQLVEVDDPGILRDVDKRQDLSI